MTRGILDELRKTGDEQLAAVREGAIPRLEKLENRRRELIEDLGSADLGACAAADPDGVAALLREILDTERLVRIALQGRIEQRREALKQIDKRLSAQKAYRKMSA